MKSLNELSNTESIKAIPELLVPAGDFDCVMAGVQNGADCIYFGANSFSARASAKNFSLEELKEVVEYCKLRNVKTNLTLNTLITDSEFSSALEVAKAAYKYGVDAIIVQDIGLAKYLIEHFPGIEIHGSTQMSVHNLEGVLELEKLGFSRVVLSREVPLNEIEYIRNNCKVDLEVFVHGALCISYSGQCLFSSLVGGRSGNRGKCAQPCRLPYELIECNENQEKAVDKGYLLSPRDLCSLEYLPKLVNLGINSFKIEGRMKTPEYVATVTRIYRKHIDLALSNKDYIIDEADKRDLLQVFNRGGFSEGHLLGNANHNLIFPEKPNNMGIYLGTVSNYNGNKGHITLKLNDSIGIGDTISIDGETGKYTVSELIKGNTNLKTALSDNIVKLGRMKGKIRPGAKVYKLSSRELVDGASKSFANNVENKKIPIECYLFVKKDTPIKIILEANSKPFYENISVEFVSDIIPETSINSPITKERLESQLNKLGNTPFVFESIKIDLDDNLHIPSIGSINNIRRIAISILEEKVMDKALKKRKNKLNLPSDLGVFDYTRSNNSLSNLELVGANLSNISPNANASAINLLNSTTNRSISLLLEDINKDYDYSKIEGINSIYIPLKFLSKKEYTSKIEALSNKFDLYVYMPTIIKPNYRNLILSSLDEILSRFSVKGFVISNISGFELLSKYIGNSNYNFVANYTMNIFNKYSIEELKKLGINTITPSVELNKNTLQELCKNSALPVELIAYGRTILMNSSYCLLGKSNKCYPECAVRCSNTSKYYLKDRLGFKFRIVPDNIQTVTAIYNSKITSIDTQDFNVNSLRINVFDESIEEINNIIQNVKIGKKLEGKDYTNGNVNKEI